MYNMWKKICVREQGKCMTNSQTRSPTNMIEAVSLWNLLRTRLFKICFIIIQIIESL